ncbi:hypothetical protein BJ508DRAFT_334938 [Ascobolus immersus RN42]|uniref:Uncharacterized protein n=1 Tax=Ascobolus immersus RN42 TaxID=1160509 RepID=A0A3N4HHP2_ASCIM|nr:hypothetical protein BJ508DRAFT_334938 [Ascobolus immersus RN42]
MGPKKAGRQERRPRADNRIREPPPTKAKRLETELQQPVSCDCSYYGPVYGTHIVRTRVELEKHRNWIATQTEREEVRRAKHQEDVRRGMLPTVDEEAGDDFEYDIQADPDHRHAVTPTSVTDPAEQAELEDIITSVPRRNPDPLLPSLAPRQSSGLVVPAVRDLTNASIGSSQQQANKRRRTGQSNQSNPQDHEPESTSRDASVQRLLDDFTPILTVSIDELLRQERGEDIDELIDELANEYGVGVGVEDPEGIVQYRPYSTAGHGL